MCTDVIEKTEFEITELSESAKQHAYEKWRENAGGYEWWDWIYEEWTEKLSNLGIEVSDIYFSGFWSQGGGACFTGRVRAELFITAHATPENGMLGRYHMLVEANKENYTGNFNITHSGHYYHSNSVSAADLELCEFSPSSGVYKDMDNDTFIRLADEQAEAFETEAFEICQGYMGEIYKELEEQYDFITSMEEFIESSKANEWLFDEDGDQI